MHNLWPALGWKGLPLAHACCQFVYCYATQVGRGDILALETTFCTDSFATGCNRNLCFNRMFI